MPLTQFSATVAWEAENETTELGRSLMHLPVAKSIAEIDQRSVVGRARARVPTTGGSKKSDLFIIYRYDRPPLSADRYRSFGLQKKIYLFASCLPA